MTVSKRRTQAERREEAETRLVEAAQKLVAERGYDGFTLADVGLAAGYSRGLPAHYFGRKEDLLALVAQNTVDSYAASLAGLPGYAPGLPRLAASIRKYVGTHSRATKALNMLISEATVRPGLKSTITRLNARGLAGLKAELQAGIVAGNIKADAEVDATARVIYAFLRGQMSFSALEPRVDTTAVSEEFIALLYARIGVGPAPT